MGKCVVCGGQVDWELIKEEFGEMLDQVDYHGQESLTDSQQVVYSGKCCSRECYEQL